MRLIFANWLLGLDVEKLVPLEIKQYIPSDNKCKLKNTNSILKKLQDVSTILVRCLDRLNVKRNLAIYQILIEILNTILGIAISS